MTLLAVRLRWPSAPSRIRSPVAGVALANAGGVVRSAAASCRPIQRARGSPAGVHHRNVAARIERALQLASSGCHTREVVVLVDDDVPGAAAVPLRTRVRAAEHIYRCGV